MFWQGFLNKLTCSTPPISYVFFHSEQNQLVSNAYKIEGRICKSQSVPLYYCIHKLVFIRRKKKRSRINQIINLIFSPLYDWATCVPTINCLTSQRIWHDTMLQKWKLSKLGLLCILKSSYTDQALSSQHWSENMPHHQYIVQKAF